MLAPDVGSGQAEVFAQKIRQQAPGFDIAGVGAAIDGDCNGAFADHRVPAPWPKRHPTPAPAIDPGQGDGGNRRRLGGRSWG